MENDEKIDRLSSLPEDLLLMILSLLSVNELVATRLLAKRWRFLWKNVSHLNYTNFGVTHLFLHQLVSNYSPLCIDDPRALKSFHLKLHPLCEMKLYIIILYRLCVKKVILESLYSTLTLANNLWYSPFWTLETLILEKLSIVDIPTPDQEHRFRFLKTLHLLTVKFSDDQAVQSLLSICPILEDLVVRRTKYANVRMYTIDVPTLRSLTIHYLRPPSQPAGDFGFVINAPSVRYFNIKDDVSNVLRFGHMPELLKVNVRVTSRLLGPSFTSTQYSPPPCSPVLWNLLKKMLKDAPKLQILNLELKDDATINDPNESYFVPECLSSHLKVFEWRHCKEAKQEAKYILANASGLKSSTTFSSASEKKIKIFKKLEYVKGSEACQLTFE